jgi:hypothetical protein
MNTAIRNSLQDRLNALHIRCRLREIGMSPKWARRVAMAWEVVVHPVLYKTMKETA